jgi:hypothetical protein
MTDLSPAAEAVLNAVTLNRYDVPYYACPKSIDQIKSDVSAALRAAADQLGYGDGSGDPIINEYELLAIADELDGAND